MEVDDDEDNEYKFNSVINNVNNDLYDINNDIAMYLVR